jgi:hypothetical protein
MEKEDDNFHFIESGIGAGMGGSSTDGFGFNLGMANSLGKYMANFLDYNGYFNKSGINRHEVSIKIGPYLRIDKNSYLAVSTGASMFIKSSNSSWGYKNGMYVYEEQYQINIPVQLKVNAGIYKGFCIGAKATYNKMIDKYNPDKASVLVYVALGF